MSQDLEYTIISHFREGIASNHIEKLPQWIMPLVLDEYSPLRTLLHTIQPNVAVELKIVLKILDQ